METVKTIPGKIEAQVFMIDEVRITFVASSVEENMWHLIIEFIKDNDSDYNYLSTSEIAEIYNLKL